MGLIVELEGNEKSGKSTVIDKITKELIGKGYNVLQMSFPSNNFIGLELQNLLKGRVKYSDKVTNALFEIDKIMFAEELKNAYKKYHVVLLDRYKLSGQVYGELREDGIEILENIQKEVVDPHLTVFLDVPVADIIKRESKDTEDIVDNNKDYLKRIEKKYREVIDKGVPNLVRIDGTRSPEEISKLAVEVIEDAYKGLERGRSLCDRCTSSCKTEGKVECEHFDESISYYRQEDCDYCGEFSLTRSSPFTAGESNIRMCKECWEKNEEVGEWNL